MDSLLENELLRRKPLLDMDFQAEKNNQHKLNVNKKEKNYRYHWQNVSLIDYIQFVKITKKALKITVQYSIICFIIYAHHFMNIEKCKQKKSILAIIERNSTDNNLHCISKIKFLINKEAVKIKMLIWMKISLKLQLTGPIIVACQWNTKTQRQRYCS